MTMADVTANAQATTTSSPSILPSNLPLFSAFLSFALAQFLKIFTTWCVLLTLPFTSIMFRTIVILLFRQIRTLRCVCVCDFQDPACYLLVSIIFVFRSTIHVVCYVCGQEFIHIWALGFEIRVLCSKNQIIENESAEKIHHGMLAVLQTRFSFQHLLCLPLNFEKSNIWFSIVGI